MKQYDKLWKGVIETFAQDFICFFFPRSDQVFDFTRGIEFLDQELLMISPPEDQKFKTRYVDKLIKLFTQTGTEEFILIHAEVQGQRDDDFAKRLFTYYYRILDKFDKDTTTLVIFTDADKDFHPRFYERRSLNTRLLFEFQTYKVLDQDEKKLTADPNPFAVAILIAKLALKKGQLKDLELLDQAFFLAKRLIKRQIPKEQIGKLLAFLRHYLSFENRENDGIFESTLKELTKGDITMGIEDAILEIVKEESKEEGVQEGLKKAALEMKKMGYDVEAIIAVTGLPKEDIENL